MINQNIHRPTDGSVKFGGIVQSGGVNDKICLKQVFRVRLFVVSVRLFICSLDGVLHLLNSLMATE